MRRLGLGSRRPLLLTRYRWVLGTQRLLQRNLSSRSVVQLLGSFFFCYFLFDGLLLLLVLHALNLAFFALDQAADVLVQFLQLLDVVGVILLVTRPIIMLNGSLANANA